jgi:glutathione S-transferase
MICAALRKSDRAVAAAVCAELANRAWLRGDSSLANAATALAITLAGHGPYLGDLRRLLRHAF